MATVKDFVEFWLENSVHADEQFGPRRGRADIKELVDRLVRFAEGQGYTRPQIEAEIGDLYQISVPASTGRIPRKRPG